MTLVVEKDDGRCNRLRKVADGGRGGDGEGGHGEEVMDLERMRVEEVMIEDAMQVAVPSGDYCGRGGRSNGGTV